MTNDERTKLVATVAAGLYAGITTNEGDKVAIAVDDAMKIVAESEKQVLAKAPKNTATTVPLSV